MKHGVLTVSCGAWLALALVGCCSPSEREVAKRLDRTLEITEQASNLLAADPELSRLPIEVDGFKNAMRLKGDVTAQTQKDRAEKLLWGVPGVQSVENLLRVEPEVR